MIAGDAVAETDKRGELVDAFLADQGRVHVGDEQRLLPSRERLNDRVDRLAVEMRLERGALLRDVSHEHEVGGDALVEPAPALDPAEG